MSERRGDRRHDETQRPRVVARDALLAGIVRGKHVLDLGAADALHIDLHRDTGLWLHATLAAAAAKCVGVDADHVAVRRLQAEGFDVRHGDVETLELGELFDVIVAGELIEHVLNVGQFLDSARRHLAPGGILVLTTPNSLSLHAHPGPLAFLRRTSGINPTHVAWYCATTFRQALELNSWHVIEQGFCASSSSTALKAALRRIAYAAKPSWAETLFAIAEPNVKPDGAQDKLSSNDNFLQ